jgi:hypothetical protein
MACVSLNVSVQGIDIAALTFQLLQENTICQTQHTCDALGVIVAF